MVWVMLKEFRSYQLEGKYLVTLTANDELALCQTRGLNL